ncbi:MAG: SRPBCC domain-containing protein [Caulobacterales bacterium]
MIAAKPSLTLVRRIKASPARVYAAWTDPAQVLCWWGTAGAVTLRADLDVRVGGRFDIGFRTPDGERHDVGGVYQEVVQGRRLVFSWSWRTTPERQSLVSVRIEPDGAGAMLTLTHERLFDEAARDRHAIGWGETLDNLEAFLAGDGPTQA